MQNIRPKNLGIGMKNLPNTQVGVHADANAFGAGRARQTQELANAGLRASLAVTDEAQRRMVKEDNAHTLYANNTLRVQDQEKSKALFEKYQGKEADKLPNAMAGQLDALYGDISKSLTNDHQRRAFEESFQIYKTQRIEQAYQQRDSQMEAFRQSEIKGQRELIQQSAEGKISLENGYKDAIDGSDYGAYILNISTELKDRNLPKEIEELAFQAARKDWHQRKLTACGAVSPEMALQYLDDERVKGAFNEAELKGMREKYGNQLLEGAKKRAENEMRQLGIQLGEQYDSEIEIERALDDIEDRELADIAKKYGEARRNARLAMGKTPEETARENRESRQQAQRLLLGADPDDPADDITEEDELDAAIDTAMPEATEVRREKVRKYAVAQLKANRVKLARERKELEEKAMNTMAAAKWDVEAIDPSWPSDLQDQMLERATKRNTVKPEIKPDVFDRFAAMDDDAIAKEFQAQSPSAIADDLGGMDSWAFKHFYNRSQKESTKDTDDKVFQYQQDQAYGKNRMSDAFYTLYGQALTLTTGRDRNSDHEIVNNQFSSAFEKAIDAERRANDGKPLSLEKREKIADALLRPVMNEKDEWIFSFQADAQKIGRVYLPEESLSAGERAHYTGGRIVEVDSDTGYGKIRVEIVSVDDIPDNWRYLARNGETTRDLASGMVAIRAEGQVKFFYPGWKPVNGVLVREGMSSASDVKAAPEPSPKLRELLAKDEAEGQAIEAVRGEYISRGPKGFFRYDENANVLERHAPQILPADMPKPQHERRK